MIVVNARTHPKLHAKIERRNALRVADFIGENVSLTPIHPSSRRPRQRRSGILATGRGIRS